MMVVMPIDHIKMPIAFVGDFYDHCIYVIIDNDDALYLLLLQILTYVYDDDAKATTVAVAIKRVRVHTYSCTQCRHFLSGYILQIYSNRL